MNYFVNRLLILFSFTISIQKLNAQSIKGKYVVFSFEYSTKNSPHGTQTYYWIQHIDSIKYRSNNFNKLIISGYSNSELNECCLGKDVNPYTSNGNGSYAFDKAHYLSLDSLNYDIKKFRKKIYSFYSNKINNEREHINVYVTPVAGTFCFSKFLPLRENEKNYNGYVCMPKSGFLSYKDFWNSAAYKLILAIDYSAFKFSVLPADK